jgi:type I restriction enzyme S subunit
MKKGWENKRLCDVIQKTETINPLLSPNKEFDYIDVSSVSNASFKIEATQRLRGKDAPSRARKLVRENDILFATIRPTLQRIAIIPEYLDQQVCSTGYFVLRAKYGIDHRFIFHWLFTETFMEQMETLQKGASYPAVTDGDVRAQSIPIPPLAEQRRIVGILDEAFTGLAIAQANAATNLRNASALFESRLNDVFTNRGEEWVERRLGDIVSRLTNGYVGPIRKVYQQSGIPYLLARHVRNNQLVFDGRTFVSTEFNQQHKKSILKAGDVLLVQSGHIGHAAVVTEEHEGHNCHAMIVMTPTKNKLIGSFLSVFFLSSVMKRKCEVIRSGSTVPHLTCGLVKELKIALPDLPTQLRIVANLDALAAETHRLTAIYERKQAALAALKKSLLHKAFAGEL